MLSFKEKGESQEVGELRWVLRFLEWEQCQVPKELMILMIYT